mmetsp:Transcript_16685/g.31950  ORF Transcript_16685/g.31950 Transcript_16685/m.31950 type:complete len:213 (-) Transcript_16685:647-1285(-)
MLGEHVDRREGLEFHVLLAELLHVTISLELHHLHGTTSSHDLIVGLLESLAELAPGCVHHYHGVLSGFALQQGLHVALGDGRGGVQVRDLRLALFRRLLALNVALVQTALLSGSILPPPPTFALLLAGKHRTSAWFTADGHVSLLMESVHGHIECAQERPHLCPLHIRQGVVLDQRARTSGLALKRRVHLDCWHLHAGPRGLVLTLPSDPSI